MLDAVARTLRLDAPEREHLYRLAEVPFEAEPGALPRRVAPEVQGIIDALDPLLAVVYNSRYDILAANPAYRDLFAVRKARGIGVPNALWTLFTVTDEDSPVVHRERELPVMVATLRSAYGRHVGEPAWEEYIRALSAASPWFAQLWASGEVIPPGPRVKTFRHAVGNIRMTSQSLSIDGMPDCRIVAYTPGGRGVAPEGHVAAGAKRAAVAAGVHNRKSRPLRGRDLQHRSLTTQQSVDQWS